MRSTTITALFPIRALLGCLLAWWQPEFLIPLKASIVPLLGIVMFGMGMTLTGSVAAVVVLHNAIGLLGGYWLPRWLGRDTRECRTLAIEVGMQNSGLAVALAVKYFSVPLPSPAPCSASGITCPVRCWQASGDVSKKPLAEAVDTCKQ